MLPPMLDVYICKDFLMVRHLHVTEEDVEKLKSELLDETEAGVLRYDSGIEYAFPLVLTIDLTEDNLKVEILRERPDYTGNTILTIEAEDEEDLREKFEELKRKATGRKPELVLPLDADLNVEEKLALKLLKMWRDYYSPSNDDYYSLEELLST